MYTTLFFISPPGSDDGLQELVFTDCCPTNPTENDDDQSEVRSMSRAKKVRVFRFLVCYVTIWYLDTDQCINARTSAVRIICYISMYFQPDQYPLQKRYILRTAVYSDVLQFLIVLWYLGSSMDTGLLAISELVWESVQGNEVRTTGG